MKSLRLSAAALPLILLASAPVVASPRATSPPPIALELAADQVDGLTAEYSAPSLEPVRSDICVADVSVDDHGAAAPAPGGAPQSIAHDQIATRGSAPAECASSSHARGAAPPAPDDRAPRTTSTRGSPPETARAAARPPSERSLDTRHRSHGTRAADLHASRRPASTTASSQRGAPEVPPPLVLEDASPPAAFTSSSSTRSPPTLSATGSVADIDGCGVDDVDDAAVDACKTGDVMRSTPSSVPPGLPRRH